MTPRLVALVVAPEETARKRWATADIRVVFWAKFAVRRHVHDFAVAAFTAGVFICAEPECGESMRLVPNRNTDREGVTP